MLTRYSTTTLLVRSKATGVRLKLRIVPLRSKYLGSTGITYATSTPAVDSTITATRIDNLDGVRLRPAIQASRVSIGNDQIRQNALDVMRAAQDELSYSIGEKIDLAIAVAIGDAASTTSTVSGAQSLYGGNATSDATLSAGDVCRSVITIPIQ